MSEFTVIDLLLHGGGMLNPSLVEERGLTREQVEQLQILHLKKDQLINRVSAKAHKTKIDDLPKLRKEAEADMEELEYEMQDVWGFDRDLSRHTHRFALPWHLYFHTEAPRYGSRS